MRDTHPVAFVRRLADADATDADLLRRYMATRDEAAFAALVRRHGPAVWRVCRAVARQPADAEDAFQGTFFLLARNAGRVRNPAAVGAWLHGTAVRVATKARARRRHEPLGEEPAAPLGDLTVREAEALLHEELAALPARFRDPVVLCCLDGLSRDEAAQRLGMSVGAVKHGLERGRELLKVRLLKRGVAVGVPLLAGLLVPPVRAGVPAFHIGTVPARAITLSNEVATMVFSAKWVRAMTIGFATFAVAVAMPVLAMHGGLMQADDDPQPPNRPQAVQPQPAGKRVAEIALPGRLIRAATSRDGKILATVTLKESGGPQVVVVEFWDAATGKQVGTLGELTNYNPLHIALSADGAAFAWIHREDVSDPDIRIQVYDTKKGVLRCLTGPEPLVGGRYPEVRFSPDGKSVASSAEINGPGPFENAASRVTLWDAATGKPRGALRSTDEYASAPQFIDAGKQLVTINAKSTKAVVWDAKSGKAIRTFDLANSPPVKATAAAPDGRTLVTFHEGGTGKVWGTGTGKHQATLANAGGEFLHAGAVGVSPDGKRVAAVVHRDGGGPELKVWDLATGKLLMTKGNVGPQTVCFDAAGRVAVSDGSHTKVVFHIVPE